LRSGTTMLQTVLCSSPACNPVIGEAIFLRSIVENYSRSLGMFEQHSKYYFSDKEDLRSFCEKYLRDFINKTADRYNNPKHIVLKHPQLTPSFPQLHQLVTDAKFQLVICSTTTHLALTVGRKNSGAIRSTFGMRIWFNHLMKWS